MATVTFFTRTTKNAKPDKKINIRIRFVDGKKINLYAKSGLEILPHYFSNETHTINKQVKYKDRAKDKKYLNGLELAILEAHKELKTTPNAEWLNTVIDKYRFPDKYKEKPVTLFSFIQEFVDNAPHRINPKTSKPVSYKMIREYHATFGYLKEYAAATGKELDFNDLPILILNIYGDISPRQLRELGGNVKDRLSRIPGVNEVEVFGGVEREISVRVDPNLLTANHVSIPQIIRALQINNSNMPGGALKLDSQEILVRTIGKFSSIDEIASIIIGMGISGNPIRLMDVATVEDGTEEISSYSRYMDDPSVTLLISKRRGSHIVETTNVIEKAVDDMAKSFPQGVKYAYTARQATDVERQNREVNTNAGWGILFVIIVLFFGIGFRNALLVSIALPFSLMSAFLFMYIFGIDRTNISMFGLIMVLGIVVDGAIIMAESTYRHIEEGMRRKDAAVAAIREVGTPIMTSVLTTMVAFAPIMYMTEIGRASCRERV